MSSSLAELQSLIAQSYDEIHHPRRDHQGLQVAVVSSPQRSLKSSSCLVVEFHHKGTKYQILFSNGTTALVQVTEESQKLLSISHSQDAVEIYSDLSSQLEIIQSLEATHDLRRLLYFIFIIYFQKNRLPYPQGEIENNQVVSRTRPKALSVEKRLCLPYEVRRKLTFETKLALSDQPASFDKPVLGAELERRLVVPFLESSRKEILITRREIAKDFLQNLILQKLQKRIPARKSEVKHAESAHGPIPLPSQESFEAPKPVLKMKPKERTMTESLVVANKIKNHLEKLEKKSLKAPLKKTRFSKKPETLNYSLVPLLSDLSFERNFNRIISECIGKLNSSICAKSLNLLKIWAEPTYKRICIPHMETPKTSLLKQLTPLQSRALVVSNSSSGRKLKFASGLPISSILKAHYFNYQQNTLSALFTPKFQTFNVEIKPRRQQPLALPYHKVLALPYEKILALPYQKVLALPYSKTLALPYLKTLALTYSKVCALPYFQRLAIAYKEPEAIPLPNKEKIIALPDKPKPVLALTYHPTLALPYTKVLALPYEQPNMEILDIYKFLEPKWLDYLGMNSLPVGTLKFSTDSSCQEHTTSVDLSFSSSDDSENLLEEDDDELSLQESFIEEANQEHLPLLEAQSTSELSEIDLDLQASTQFLEKPEEEDVYGFEVIPDDEIVIIEEDVVCVNDTGY